MLRNGKISERYTEHLLFLRGGGGFLLEHESRCLNIPKVGISVKVQPEGRNHLLFELSHWNRL